MRNYRVRRSTKANDLVIGIQRSNAFVNMAQAWFRQSKNSFFIFFEQLSSSKKKTHYTTFNRATLQHMTGLFSCSLVAVVFGAWHCFNLFLDGNMALARVFDHHLSSQGGGTDLDFLWHFTPRFWSSKCIGWPRVNHPILIYLARESLSPFFRLIANIFLKLAQTVCVCER